jgi:hypothetical protein
MMEDVMKTKFELTKAGKGPQVTKPIAYDHVRDYETVSGTGNIARDSTQHKRSTVAVHDAMHRTAGTNEGAPVTSSLIDDEKMDISPVVDGTKVGKIAPVSPAMRSRTQVSETDQLPVGVAHAASAAVSDLLHADRHDNAGRMMDEAVKGGGKI